MGLAARRPPQILASGTDASWGTRGWHREEAPSTAGASTKGRYKVAAPQVTPPNLSLQSPGHALFWTELEGIYRKEEIQGTTSMAG